MTRIEILFPMHVRGLTVAESAENQFETFESWFQESGVGIHRLPYGEIPAREGFVAAYSITVKDAMFALLVYIEEPKLAMLTKLRWGGRYV